MKLAFTTLVLALAGCGVPDNHGYGWDYDARGESRLMLRYAPALQPSALNFAEASSVEFYESEFAWMQNCSQLSAPAPFVILVEPGALGTGGYYYQYPSLIVLETSSLGLLRHEIAHYLLDYNTGDLDQGHTSAMFQPGGCVSGPVIEPIPPIEKPGP